MTTRHSAYIVVLETPIREDDDNYIKELIMGIKGVVDVKPVEYDAITEAVAISHLKHEFWKLTRDWFIK